MNEKASALSLGVKLAVGGAVALVITCFLPWWDQGGEFGELREFGTGSSALSAFALPLTALVVVASAVGALILALKLRNDQTRADRGSYRNGITALGAVAALFVVFGIASPPEPTFAGESLADPASPVFGIWVALLAAISVIAGGYQISRASRTER